MFTRVRNFKTFDEVNTAVEDFMADHDRKASYSLERIEKLLNELGNPQESFKTVHIAGTSGKTSTSYYIANMLDMAGYKVGLSVSPYVEEVNERVQLGTQPLPEAVFCSEFSRFFNILNTLSVRPTYFELFVAFAYWYFDQSGIDYAVIEVGLGGLLDGTNVIERQDKICVITDIGLDHTHILGNSISKIAAQKAGIIKDHNQVFMYKQEDEINQEIIRRSSKRHAVIHFIDPSDSDINLTGFQKRNWTLAKNVCEYIFELDNQKGWDGSQWARTTDVAIPARLEIVKYKDKTMVLDGAHNPQKIHALTESFMLRFPGESPAVLLAIGDNKDMYKNEMAEDIRSLSNFTIITTFKKKRNIAKICIDPQEIAESFDAEKISIEPDLAKALDIFLARPEKLLLVTGSLYLVGAVKEILRESYK